MNTTLHAEISITGSLSKAIEIACREFEQNRQVDWSEYHTEITEAENIIVIHFRYHKTPPGYRGSVQGQPNFTVEIQKPDLNIIRSYVNR